MAFLEIIVALVLIVLVTLWLSNRRPPDFPPGPMGLPILGYFPLLGQKPHVALAQMGKKYGGLFSMPFGMEQIIILNDWKTMKEALVQQSEIFSVRPRTFLFEETIRNTDIVSIDGPLWKDKRRFTIHHLKDFGFGTKSMEVLIAEEVQSVLAFLKENANHKVDTTDLFFLPLLNILWGIIAGKKYKMDDQKMLKFSYTIKKFSVDFLKDLMVNALPALRFLPGSPHKEVMKTHYEIMQFLEDEVEDHLQTYKDEVQRDFIDVYLSEIKSQSSSDQPNPAFQKEHLIGIMYNFFNAGVETTNYTLLWSLLYVSLWPEIQRKIHHELDEVIGRNRLPTYADRTQLPYIEAVIMETHRCATIVPFSVPHATLKTTQLMGYTIPKGTQVLQNLWAVHFDPSYWKDPEVFRPERFLNEQGKAVKPEYLIPFSTGARACLGEPLAKMELFLFFSSVLHQFTLNCVTGEKLPSLDPPQALTLRPQNYSLEIKERL